MGNHTFALFLAAAVATAACGGANKPGAKGASGDGSYTIRYVEGSHQSTQPQWRAVCDAVEHCFEKLGLAGHLFVTVVGCNQLMADGLGIGLYHSGIKHVAIPAGEAPEQFTDDEWLVELQVSTVHEIVHYWQELNGTLDESEECERVTESMAYELLGLEVPEGRK